MPVSAYLKSGLFVITAAAALFAAAGTLAIASFWVYLAISAIDYTARVQWRLLPHIW
jgi:hypothetical protein